MQEFMNWNGLRVLTGDVLECLRTLPDESVHCCVTSPPYWGLRDYGNDRQIGLEKTPDAYVAKIVEVFREVRRVMHRSGTVWLNIGDSYGNPSVRATGVARRRGQTSAVPHMTRCQGVSASRSLEGIKTKDLCGIPWRVALALQTEGWWWRSTVAWTKKSPMPESVTDRPTNAWEPIFLLSKSQKYYYDNEAVKEESASGSNGSSFTEGKSVHAKHNIGLGERSDDSAFRNMRNVWNLATEPYAAAHFATFPTEIPRRALLAGTSEHGCCPKCLSPWQRIVEKTKVTRERPSEHTKREGVIGTGNSCANTVAGVSSRTIGWEPTCKCAADRTIPCTVLEPFCGSGTTLSVAQELGLFGVGIELNAEYCKLIADRIRQSTLLVSKE